MTLKKIFIELGLWYVTPIVFIIFYSSNYTEFGISTYYHLYVISLLIATTILLKVILFENFRLNIAAGLSAAIYTTVLFCLYGYYCLVIVGLKSWGKVITQELLISYYYQLPQLCEAIGYSHSLVIAALFSIYIVLYVISYLGARNFGLLPITPIISQFLSNLLLIALLTLLIFKLLDYLKYPPTNSMEPISLTLLAGKPKTTNHNVAQGRKSNVALDHLEDTVRSSYIASPDVVRKNLILIVVDALRPSHMGIYGYKRNTTPHLDELKRLGFLQKINNVHASCGESACGLASIASSRYTHQLPNNPFTIQQLLQKYGYEITMILGGDHTNFYNLKDIYGHVDHYYDGSMARNRYMNDDLLVLDKTKDLPVWNEVPAMIQFHLMSAHTLGKRQPEYLAFLPSHSYAGRTTGLPEEKYTNYYDNGVLQADSVINELLITLRSKGYLENALVVITADHGESLGEHNLYAHANSVREELLNIPLLFISFNDENMWFAQKREFISQIDIAPTILNDFKMEIPKTWSGKSINDTRKSDFSFFQLSPDSGLYDHRNANALWKYWKNMRTGEEFAFNLTLDPSENENMIFKVGSLVKKEWRLELPNSSN